MKNKNKIKFTQMYVSQDGYTIELVGRGEQRFSAFVMRDGTETELGFFKTKPEAVAACEAHHARELAPETAAE